MKLTKYYGFQLSEKIQNLELTSEVILETYLEKIKKFNPKINAIVSMKNRNVLL